MRIFLNYLLFFLLYVVGSRILFIPAGISLGMGKYVVLSVVFIFDILQIPLYFYIYDKGTSRIKFLSFLYSKMPSKERMLNSPLLKFAERLGAFGVVFVAAMPAFGGGMWTSILMAYFLKIDRRKSVLLLALGSLIGCLIVVFGFDGLIHLFKFKI
ncbi:hypothetical protein COY52_11930 [Candidatus Desantisbacteria bacterium CG_4_10_14_0_8_um_filter_48_22]|uniref:Ligand-binding protein SH3 n=1 Tax=Candidatus Desantisbacteria bacterium CG_4_10_14_0_8_um_filter_48_22 TaxID=1974543 RepID=A0A2M7S4U7_9BACT|nr:MAG: hypothetical protein AUJ67_01835 [Candidatus Desantisbacteria bacterium CG1_02_49_89]PIV56062.1 MAG: hypothetical protein COS16_05135 [Candidatus Desantisbacteria bacterium CG02_land_8_20_14_3_00_49_13]PIZ14585.1 MAG: hypothetical protein COY52_11930 [Candidatus Desantisbacteria bacterium CG_4_10_14_0_8_um_filter_48_22]PJB28823.1 MAG: hypothetical protein CO111_00600 [Candidatus Desantisbacteria bacterium CG_4_9_14_3_um_filter_50_7]